MPKMNSLKRLLCLSLVLFGCRIQAKADTTDNYQIYLNNKIVIRESDYNNPLSSTIKFLILDSTTYNDTIKINYSHCTSGALNRKIIIKDTSGKIIFNRDFPNKNEEVFMIIPVKDILGTQSVKSNSTLTMYYFDQPLLPHGVILSLIGIRDKPVNTSAKPIAKSSRAFIISAITLFIIIAFAIWRRRSTTANTGFYAIWA